MSCGNSIVTSRLRNWIHRNDTTPRRMSAVGTWGNGAAQHVDVEAPPAA